MVWMGVGAGSKGPGPWMVPETKNRKKGPGPWMVPEKKKRKKRTWTVMVPETSVVCPAISPSPCIACMSPK